MSSLFDEENRKTQFACDQGRERAREAGARDDQVTVHHHAGLQSAQTTEGNTVWVRFVLRRRSNRSSKHPAQIRSRSASQRSAKTRPRPRVIPSVSACSSASRVGRKNSPC